MELTYVFLVLTILEMISLRGQVCGDYEGARYYWPMSSKEKDPVVLLDQEYSFQADLHGVKLISVSKLGSAASLKPPLSWIDVDAGATPENCLAFQFSSEFCNDEALTVAMWIRMTGGNGTRKITRRVLATGSYTKSTDGPGILMEYNEHKQLLSVIFTSKKRSWRTEIRLPMYSWCHVLATWNGARNGKGLRVVLDGKDEKPQYTARDPTGTARASRSEKYGRMISIGYPLDHIRPYDYGGFDLSHLVFYYIELQDYQLKFIYDISLKTPTDEDLQCCTNKSVDPCYTNPCSCTNLEKRYEDCVYCKDLDHKICQTSSPPTSSTGAKVSTRTSTSLNKCSSPGVQGCQNILNSQDNPICGDEKCFYGRCEKKKRCMCPSRCSKEKRLVCGDDGNTYFNHCTLKRISCQTGTRIKKRSCAASSLPMESYYWPFDRVVNGQVKEFRTNKTYNVLNKITTTPTEQLGNALLLNNKHQWIDLKNLEKLCIWSNECSKGITVGFWLHYSSGDDIISAGNQENGFRIKKQNRYHTLEMTSGGKEWKIFIAPQIPQGWLYLSFSWNADEGLKLYFNADEIFSSERPQMTRSPGWPTLDKSIRVGSRYGRVGKMDFKISHLSIWEQVLKPGKLREAYSKHVMITKTQHVQCCPKKKQHQCRTSFFGKNNSCVCLKNDVRERCRRKGCKDAVDDCKKLICNQNICQNNHPFYGHLCARTCGMCGNDTMGLDTSKCFHGRCNEGLRANECNCSRKCSDKRDPVCSDGGFTFINQCLLKEYSCKMNKNIVIAHKGTCADHGSAPIKKASYYWPFDGMESPSESATQGKGSAILVRELKKNVTHEVHNGGKIIDAGQLGKGLHLDNSNLQWVDIKDLAASACIWKAECSDGISVGFWIHFISGDYILAARAFEKRTKGFRIQRDSVTKYHALEVVKNQKMWKLYIKPIPKKWVYLSFTWNEEEGLKLYLDGQLTFKTTKYIHITRGEEEKEEVGDDGNGMVIGHAPSGSQMYGNFTIAHLAIWQEALDARDMSRAFAAHVRMNPKDIVKCYKVRERFIRKRCEEWSNIEEWDKNDAICPKITSQKRVCDKKGNDLNFFAVCQDELEHCKMLNEKQDVCQVQDPRFAVACRKTCGKCMTMDSSVAKLLGRGRKQHFTPQTLIFALLGCVGGLVVLLGATVYFWKVYRTRYQGAFIPTIKNVSLLDVSDYEDEKWPQKYIDSASYYIKDVPPKKNPLPVIPAKVKQNPNMYRYQPPEFD